MTDVAHELAGQVLDRGEDPAGNHIALDPGKPVLDLVEPGGVGRSVVEMYFGVSREELLNPLIAVLVFGFWVIISPSWGGCISCPLSMANSVGVKAPRLPCDRK